MRINIENTFPFPIPILVTLASNQSPSNDLFKLHPHRFSIASLPRIYFSLKPSSTSHLSSLLFLMPLEMITLMPEKKVMENS